jgi:hypothetical protein
MLVSSAVNGEIMWPCSTKIGLICERALLPILVGVGTGRVGPDLHIFQNLPPSE